MNRLLSWIVGNSKPRWLFRVAMVSVLLVFSWVYSMIHTMEIQFHQKMALQAEMWKLDEDVRLLELDCSDSILLRSRDSATSKMLKDWHDFAIWSEKARNLAIRKEVDMDWKVGDLKSIPGYGMSVSSIPVSIKVLPWSRSFEETISYVQNLSKNSKVAWRLEEVWIQGTGEGVVDSRILLQGWILQ